MVNPADYKFKQKAKYSHDLSVDMFIFRKGKYVTQQEIDKSIIFDIKTTMQETLKFDQIINDSTCLLVNQRTVDILNKLIPEEIQFFETEIRCKDGVLTNYKLVNITQEVEGVDHEKSLYDKMINADAISGFMRLKLIKNCMNGYKVARLAEFHGHMLATEEIKQAFEAARVTGLRFVTPEDYYAAIYPNYAQRQITHSQLVIQFYQTYFKDDKFFQRLQNTVKNEALDAEVTVLENNDEALSLFIATMDPIKTFEDVYAIFKDYDIDEESVKAGYCAFSSNVYIPLWPKDLKEFNVT